MKKISLYLLVQALTITVVFGQCNTQIVNRPDGVTMEYFNPNPVIITDAYEVGTAIYKNKTTGDLTLNISVVFKTKTPKKLTGNAILQTASDKGITLTPVISQLMKMNGRDVTLGLFLITQRDYEILKDNQLKSIYFYLEGELIGSTVNENKSLLIHQLKCLSI